MTQPGPIRTVSGREADRTAGARCRAYALFSDLTASPQEVDTREPVAQRIGRADEGLPYPLGLDDLLREFAIVELRQLQAEYSGLFEVGSQGPPAPIREDLQTGQKAGTREDIVRFYDYFGYRLGDRHAWAPDHLSVELEFMHFLCYHEAQQAADRLSYQLAQADFTERHLQRWVPRLAAEVARLAPATLYCRVIGALGDFIARDLAWQNSTILMTGEGPRT
jgi:DMSO reductase family type II enzyme chaperone